MNHELIIIGAGGHGRVVADAARCSGVWTKIVFVDDQYAESKWSGDVEIIAPLDQLPSLAGTRCHAIVAIGDNRLRLDLQGRLKNMGFTLATIIHPSAQIARDVNIGHGSVLLANSVVNVGAVLGESVIINTAATVDHNGRIGDGVHLSPGVNLAGNVVIGEGAWLGIGAAVVNDCAIGRFATVGAGAVVINDIPDAATAVGIPAKPL